MAAKSKRKEAPPHPISLEPLRRRPMTLTPDEFEQRCHEWLDYCEQTGKPPTKGGLCAYMGVNLGEYSKWMKRPSHFEIMAFVETRIVAAIEERLLTENPVGPSKWLEAQARDYGWMRDPSLEQPATQTTINILAQSNSRDQLVAMAAEKLAKLGITIDQLAAPAVPVTNG